MERIKKICYAIKRLLITLTAGLTVGVVSFISYAYLTVYLNILNKRHEFHGGDGLSAAYIAGPIFILFPILIFWVLIQIVLSDPGYVTKKMVEQIY